MKKAIASGLAVLLLVTVIAGCGELQPGGYQSERDSLPGIGTAQQENIHSAPDTAPWLELMLIAYGLPEQRIQAMQLVTRWDVTYADGTSRSYGTDSAHALQMHQRDYETFSLRLERLDGRIELRFSDNYPPENISAQRWYAEYATGNQNIADVVDKSEPVEVSGSMISVTNDGRDYIYEIHATWPNGNSRYAFRILNQSDKQQAHYSFTELVPSLSDWTSILVDAGSTLQFAGLGLLGKAFAQADETQAQRLVDSLMVLYAAEFMEVDGNALFGGGVGIDDGNVTGATSALTLIVEGASGRCVFDICAVPNSTDDHFYLRPRPIAAIEAMAAMENPTADDIPIVHIYEFFSDSFSLIDLVRAQVDVLLDSTDMRNVAIVSRLDSEGTEHIVNKGLTARLRQIMDGVICDRGAYDGNEAHSFDTKIVVGDTTYMLDSSSGYFSRELCGETMVSLLDESWLFNVLQYAWS